MPHPQSRTLSAGVAVKRQRCHATAYYTLSRHTVGESRAALVPGSLPGGETKDNGVTRHSIRLVLLMHWRNKASGIVDARLLLRQRNCIKSGAIIAYGQIWYLHFAGPKAAPFVDPALYDTRELSQITPGACSCFARTRASQIACCVLYAERNRVHGRRHLRRTLAVMFSAVRRYSAWMLLPCATDSAHASSDTARISAVINMSVGLSAPVASPCSSRRAPGG